MNFSQSVQTCITKYVDFSGRATRSEYWWFFLFVIVASTLLSFVSSVLSGLFYLGMLMPTISAATRRLHDTDRSGWWQLISLVPLIGAIVILVFLAQASQEGANEHGPAPSGAGRPMAL